MRPVLRFKYLSAILLSCLVVSGQDHWVATWGTAQQMVKGVGLPGPRPGVPAAPTTAPGAPARRFPIPPRLDKVENQTVRMIVRASAGGKRVRIRLQSALGVASVRIGAAHIALYREGSSIVPGSDRTLTFGSQSAVTLYGGGTVVSDPATLDVPPSADLAVSLYIQGSAPDPTTHLFGLRTTYVASGDVTGAPSLTGATTMESYYWLAGVDVLAPASVGTIVAFGDSITDGDQSAPNSLGMWPAILATRLKGKWGVVNAGISGNRLLGDGSSGVVRLMHDALSHPGVRWLMVLEGINDITGATRPGASGKLTAEDLIEGYRQIIEIAHLYGVRVAGCTITPYGGSSPYSESGETMRQAVNQWIRKSGSFDAVMDFDAAVRDSKDPTRFRAEADSPDLLHPGNAGYKLMGEAVDLAIFNGAKPRF